MLEEDLKLSQNNGFIKNYRMQVKKVDRVLEDDKKIKELLWGKMFITFYTMQVIKDKQDDLMKQGIVNDDLNEKDVNDELQHQQIEMQENKRNQSINVPSYLIDPDWVWYRSFQILTMVLMLWTVTFMPYSLAFREASVPQSMEWWADLMIDGVFMIDMVLNFFIPYWDEERKMMVAMEAIAKNQVNTWFLVDFVSCMPFNLLSSAVDVSSGVFSNTSMLKILRLPRVWKMFKLLRLFRTFKFMAKHPLVAEIIENLQLNEWILQLLYFLGFVIFGVHIVSCIWFFFSSQVIENSDSWLVRYNIYYEHNGSQIRDETYPEILIQTLSFQWSMITLTTIGYGDIFSTSTPEMIISIIWMLVGVGFYSQIVGTLTSVFANIENNSNFLQRKLTIIEQFASDSKLSKNLRNRIKMALEQNCSKTNFLWFKKQRILDELPMDLRYEFSTQLHNGVIKKLFFFWEKSNNFVHMQAPLLMPVFQETGVTIQDLGESPRQIQMINEGRVNFLSSDDLIFKTFINGSYFGEIEVFFEQDRTFKVKAEIDSHLFTLRVEDFVSIKDQFREDWLELKEMAAEKNMRLFESQQKVQFEQYKQSYTRSLGVQSGQQMLILKYYKYTQMKLTKKILDRARIFRNKIVTELAQDTEQMLKKKSKFTENQEVDNVDSEDSNFSELEEEELNLDKKEKNITLDHNERTIHNIKRKNILSLINNFYKETKDKAAEMNQENIDKFDIKSTINNKTQFFKKKQEQTMDDMKMTDQSRYPLEDRLNMLEKNVDLQIKFLDNKQKN